MYFQKFKHSISIYIPHYHYAFPYIYPTSVFRIPRVLALGFLIYGFGFFCCLQTNFAFINLYTARTHTHFCSYIPLISQLKNNVPGDEYTQTHSHAEKSVVDFFFSFSSICLYLYKSGFGFEIEAKA